MNYNPEFALAVDSTADFKRRLEALQKLSDEAKSGVVSEDSRLNVADHILNELRSTYYSTTGGIHA